MREVRRKAIRQDTGMGANTKKREALRLPFSDLYVEDVFRDNGEVDPKSVIAIGVREFAGDLPHVAVVNLEGLFFADMKCLHEVCPADRGDGKGLIEPFGLLFGHRQGFLSPPR
jgi:hypothetical protein